MPLSLLHERRKLSIASLRRAAMTGHRNDTDALDEVDGEPLVALVRPTADFSDGLHTALDPELARLVPAIATYAAAAQAPNTTKAYESDWRQFEHWAPEHQLPAMPASPATCALYLTALAQRGLKVSTIRLRAAAITRAHRQAGQASVWDPRVLTVLEGIARTHGAAPTKKVALLRDPLLEFVDWIDQSTPAGLRDRALLLLGFALGLRRSELRRRPRRAPLPSPRRPHRPPALLEDRPDRRRTRLPARLRPDPEPMPGARRTRMDRSDRTDQRPARPPSHAIRSGVLPPLRAVDHAHHQTSCGSRRP